MIEELHLRNLGVIAAADLPLGPGLTAVTGETGAGKTMVVTGLLLLFGGRGDAARVRAGSEQASVEGRVAVADPAVTERVEAAGGSLDDDGTLVLRRTLSASGRSRAHVGGAAAPVAVLADLAETLLAVHGQSDQVLLSRPSRQREALDRFAGVDLSAFRAAFDRWRAADADLRDRLARAGELRREIGLLEHGLAEIERVAPQPGEDRETAALAARLGAADALRSAARTDHDALVGDSDVALPDAADVASLVAAGARALAQAAGADPELDGLAARLADLGALAADLGTDLRAYADALDLDPGQLEQVQQRRAELQALVRRYGDGPEPDVDAVLAWAEQARERLARIDVSEEALGRLAAERDRLGEAASAAAGAVRGARSAAAATLERAVSAELADLAMPDARLVVQVRPRPAGTGPALEVAGVASGVGADGADEVEFQLQPHSGTTPLPLGKGASGGELSRVMLALEACLAGTDPVPTMIFDEVDAGVGGRAATEVGRRLARLARDRQVIVVTHLAQVAAFADRHVMVDKSAGPDSASGVTASDVRVVTGTERLAELARMLSGRDSDTARGHAAELLAAAAAPPGRPPRIRAKSAR